MDGKEEPHMKPSCFALPQMTLDYHQPLPETQRLLLIGGRAPSAAWVQEWLALPETNHNDALAICAVDRGVAICRKMNLVPDLLLGDADSASGDDWAWGAAHARRVERHPVEKDLTDTQLALKRATEDASILLLTGAFGGRFDHAYSTIFSAAQCSLPCVLADERETIAYVKSGETLSLHCNGKPKAISLLPMTSEAVGVTTKGLHWELHNATLAQAFPNAVSNVLEKNKCDVTISIASGCLAVYVCWEKKS